MFIIISFIDVSTAAALIFLISYTCCCFCSLLSFLLFLFFFFLPFLSAPLLFLLLFYQTEPLYSRLPSTFCCHLPFLGPHSTWDFSSPPPPSRFSNTQSFRPSLVLLSFHPCHPCITKSYLPWIQRTQWHPLD